MPPALYRGSRIGRVAVRVLLGTLNALGLFITVVLWHTIFSGRLDGQVDAPEILLLFALAAAVVSVSSLIIGGIAVKVRWIGAWWLCLPALMLVSAILVIIGVSGDLR